MAEEAILKVVVVDGGNQSSPQSYVPPEPNSPSSPEGPTGSSSTNPLVSLRATVGAFTADIAQTASALHQFTIEAARTARMFAQMQQQTAAPRAPLAITSLPQSKASPYERLQALQKRGNVQPQEIESILADAKLTQGERRVFDLALTQGSTQADIASDLKVGQPRVSQIARSISKKLGLPEELSTILKRREKENRAQAQIDQGEAGKLIDYADEPAAAKYVSKVSPADKLIKQFTARYLAESNKAEPDRGHLDQLKVALESVQSGKVPADAVKVARQAIKKKDVQAAIEAITGGKHFDEGGEVTSIHADKALFPEEHRHWPIAKGMFNEGDELWPIYGGTDLSKIKAEDVYPNMAKGGEVNAGDVLYHASHAKFDKFKRRATWFDINKEEHEGRLTSFDDPSIANSYIRRFTGGKLAYQPELEALAQEIFGDEFNLAMLDRRLGEYSPAEVAKFTSKLKANGYIGAVHADYSGIDPQMDSTSVMLFNPEKYAKHLDEGGSISDEPPMAKVMDDWADIAAKHFPGFKVYEGNPDAGRVRLPDRDVLIANEKVGDKDAIKLDFEWRDLKRGYDANDEVSADSLEMMRTLFDLARDAKENGYGIIAQGSDSRRTRLYKKALNSIGMEHKGSGAFFKHGGRVDMSRGGQMPNTGVAESGADWHPAWLTDKEYVVNAKSSARNREALQQANANPNVTLRAMHLASGGSIPQAAGTLYKGIDEAGLSGTVGPNAMAALAAVAGPIGAAIAMVAEAIHDGMVAEVQMKAAIPRAVADPNASPAKLIADFGQTISSVNAIAGEMARQFGGLMDAVQATSTRYGEYSPDIAVAQAMVEVQHTMGEMRRAQEGGPALARYLRAQGDLQQKFEDVKIKLLTQMLPLITNIVSTVENLMPVGEGAVEALRLIAGPMVPVAEILARVAAALEDANRPAVIDPTDAILQLGPIQGVTVPRV